MKDFWHDDYGSMEASNQALSPSLTHKIQTKNHTLLSLLRSSLSRKRFFTHRLGGNGERSRVGWEQGWGGECGME